MRKTLQFYAVFAALVTCSIAFFPLASHAAKFLTKGELQEQFVGNTFRGIWEGNTYYEYMRSDGSLRGLMSRERYSGKWCFVGDKRGKCSKNTPDPATIPDSETVAVCFTYGEEESDGCWMVSREGETFTYYTKNGKKDFTEKILLGNPKKL